MGDELATRSTTALRGLLRHRAPRSVPGEAAERDRASGVAGHHEEGQLMVSAIDLPLAPAARSAESLRTCRMARATFIQS